MDGHPAGSRQLAPYLRGDVQLFPPLMHTEADAAVDSKGIPAAGNEAWLPLCPRTPFLLLYPWLTLTSKGPRSLRCVWTGTDVFLLKIWTPIESLRLEKTSKFTRSNHLASGRSLPAWEQALLCKPGRALFSVGEGHFPSPLPHALWG